MSDRYAAIDIGTVTCRMLIADVDERGFLSDCTREYAIVNLGEGVDATGVLKPEAMARTMAAIDGYLSVQARFDTREHPIRATVVMATSAARDAKNSDEFRRLLAERGLRLAVIPGEREAELSFLGASHEFSGERLLVVDIGGGSTELVMGVAGSAPEFAHSFNIGCRRVTERFLHGDPPSKAELLGARSRIREEMAPHFDELRTSGLVLDRLVAVAGTATSVVSIRDEMRVYDASRVHKAVVSRGELDDITRRLAAITELKRRQVIGLDPERAPVIVAGMLILQTVMELAQVERYTVSESDILHGMILDAVGLT